MSEQEPIIWINGALLPASQARISPLDRGFTVGCSAFETLRARRGHPFAPTRHWNRLVGSCKVLGIRPPTRDEFLEGMQQTLEANGLQEARVRFTVTAGAAPGTGAAARPNCVVHAVPFQAYPRTARVIAAPWPRNERSPLAAAKCSSYAENMLALEAAHAQGAGEAVFANTRGDLCEGATSNIFVIRDGRAVTPPLASGCLAGVTRQIVLDVCRSAGEPVEEKRLALSALKDADEAFLTSSLRGIQPIAAFGRRKLRRAPGATTRRIALLYRKIIRQDDDP